MGYLLAGDLGGTKTILALYERGAGGFAPVREARFASGDHAGFDEILAAFLADCPARPEAAVFGVAGPVLAGTARITNLGWQLDKETIQRRFGFVRVGLLNDLVAIAWAIPALEPSDLVVLNQGRALDTGSIAVVAPGTGLGEAYLCWDGEGYLPFASEGGHADFAPASEEEEALLAFLRKERDHVSCESVCSGSGLPNIYRFLTEEVGMAVAGPVAAELARAADPGPVLVRHALLDDCPVAARTIRIFLDILAAEAGNVAIRQLATGGVFLGGGLLPRLLALLEPDRFMARFSAKGRMSTILAAMPVRVIATEKAGLHGAARAASRLAAF
ncbi:MAG: glucokinase [Thermodesulfobacteriota bacterium]